MIASPATNPDMPRGRQKSQFELLSELAGFRVTPEQLEWLQSASIEAGVEAGLAEWIRRVAIEAGEKQLGKPFPRRKLLPPKKRRK